MLTFAAITPHPPIMVPGIGNDDDLKKVQKLIDAMEKLGMRLETTKPDVILLISPHAPIANPYSFGINQDTLLEGDLRQFGLTKQFSFSADTTLTQLIYDQAQTEDLNTYFYKSSLDHGALVPLSFLTQKIEPSLVHLSFSFLDFATHYKYGKVIGRIASEYNKKIAIIASGDLSHRLTPSAPAGFSPQGKVFDQKLIDCLKNNRVDEIINFDLDFIEEAGECGLRSFIILLGALSNQKYNFNFLSYEGPFGVGYLVAEFNLT